MEMNARATKLQAAENDLKQLMADVTQAMEKAQEAVARIASKAAAATTEKQIAGYLAIARGTVEYHWVEGRYDTLPMLTADLVRRRVAVIVTPGFPLAARAAKDATSAIPIVFGVGEDPVKLGLVG
jgi:putative ABC transport system substrate-binding protein